MTPAGAKLRPPQPLTPDHDCSAFDSGQSVLDEWSRRWALVNQVSRASRSFVATEGDARTPIAFYTLAMGAVSHADSIRDLRHAMPNPIPVTLLGRLAVHRSHQGRGLGAALLRDAVLRTVQISEFVGTAALLVHAIDRDAVAFYRHHGFKPSLLTPSTLMLPLKTVLASMAGAGAGHAPRVGGASRPRS